MVAEAQAALEIMKCSNTRKISLSALARHGSFCWGFTVNRKRCEVESNPNTFLSPCQETELKYNPPYDVK
jgi:hypothetical protein